VWLVELAQYADAPQVAQAAAAVLRVVERPNERLIDTLVDRLRAMSLFVVLDNCEHLVEAVAEFAAALLRACPRLTIGTTSRECLGVPGEVVWPVPPLSVAMDDNLESVRASEAARLFVQRAQSVRPDFVLSDSVVGSVAEICRQLDGLPLAIELAAARASTFEPFEIARNLHNTLGTVGLASRTAPARHQTLDGALSWSYTLLDHEEQRLFRRLCVFAGGFSLDGAQALGGADVLHLLPQLVIKSMVQVEGAFNASRRYRLLEPLRQFARARLVELGELEPAQREHAQYILRLAEQARDQQEHGSVVPQFEALNAEAGNIRAAMDWSLEVSDADLAARLAAALWFWLSRPDRQARARTWLERVLALSERAQNPSLRGHVMAAPALVASAQGDMRAATDLAAQALDVARVNGEAWLRSMALSLIGMSLTYTGDMAGAEAALLEALECTRGADLPWIESRSLDTLGQLALARGDVAAAEQYIRDSPQGRTRTPGSLEQRDGAQHPGRFHAYSRQHG